MSSIELCNRPSAIVSNLSNLKRAKSQRLAEEQRKKFPERMVSFPNYRKEAAVTALLFYFLYIPASFTGVPARRKKEIKESKRKKRGRNKSPRSLQGPKSMDKGRKMGNKRRDRLFKQRWARTGELKARRRTTPKGAFSSPRSPQKKKKKDTETGEKGNFPQGKERFLPFPTLYGSH